MTVRHNKLEMIISNSEVKRVIGQKGRRRRKTRRKKKKEEEEKMIEARCKRAIGKIKTYH